MKGGTPFKGDHPDPDPSELKRDSPPLPEVSLTSTELIILKGNNTAPSPSFLPRITDYCDPSLLIGDLEIREGIDEEEEEPPDITPPTNDHLKRLIPDIQISLNSTQSVRATHTC